MLTTVVTVALVVVATLVLVAVALGPHLARTVPDDVVAPARTGYGRAPGLVAAARAEVDRPARDHDLAA